MTHTLLFRQLIYAFQAARHLNLQAEGNPLPIAKAQSWSRRRFVRSLTLAGGAALASGSMTHLARAWSLGRPPTIAIIGGGLAGLNAAYWLKQAGLKATVYEARARLGGRVQSVIGAIGPGLVTDLGGSLINTDHGDMLALVKTFKLKLFNRVKDAERFSAPPTAYFFEQQIRPEAEIAEKLRPLARQIGKDAALLDQDFDQFAPLFDRLSATQYLDQHVDKIPEPFIRVLIEHACRTEFGVEPDHCSALQLVQVLPIVKGESVNLLSYSDEVFVVQGGSGKIIEGLASALPGQIQTRMRLSELRSQGDGFQLTFANRAIVNADYVVLAIPFTLLRKVNLKVDLPTKLKRFIEEGDLGSNDKLFAGFSQKVWRRKDIFSQEIWTDLGFAEAWDETQRQTDRKDGALNFFFGGDQVKALEIDSPQTVGRKIIRRLEAAIPGAQAAATGKFLRTQWSHDPFTQGAYANFKPGQLTAFSRFFYIESDKPSEQQNVHVGNLVFAGEHLSDEFYGFMNGAAQTGRLAAQLILRKVEP
jgi:monoamine oxidase